MARLTANVTLRDPESGEVVTFLEGDELPKWAHVGAHLTEGSPEPEPETKPTRTRKVAEK